MSEANWKKLRGHVNDKGQLNDTNYTNGLLGALAIELISPSDIVSFVDHHSEIYGLPFNQLRDTLKETLYTQTGYAFPESKHDEVYKIAMEAMCASLENNKETYGPSFPILVDGTIILVATEKAIKSLGLDSSVMETMDIRKSPEPDLGEPNRSVKPRAPELRSIREGGDNLLTIASKALQSGFKKASQALGLGSSEAKNTHHEAPSKNEPEQHNL